MNQPTKSRPSSPSTGATDTPGSDWGLDVPKKRGPGETRIGLLLVVCLIGAVGYLTWRKLEERRRTPHDTDFREPVASLSSQEELDDAPPTEQSEERTGATADWPTAPGDQPDFGDQTMSQTAAAGAPDFASLPPVQREPAESVPRTFADEPPLEFVRERNAPQYEPAPETHPVASDSGFNPFAADTSLESPQSDRPEAPYNASTARTVSGLQGEVDRDAPPGWLENPQSEPAPAHESDTTEFITSVDTRSGRYDTGPEEVVGDLYGGDAQPVEPAAADADVVVESSDRPFAEPLLVPAEDARVMPVVSDGSAGAFTQRAAAETSGSDPWDSAAPRELAQNGNPSVIEPDFGSTSAATGSGATTNSGSDPGFLPDSGQSGTGGNTWTSSGTGTVQTGSSGSDPFSQSSAVGGTASSDQVAVHIVQSGDNFWTIAHKYYSAGRYANALAAFNQTRIPDPRRMRPGMKVLIPDSQVLIQRFPKLTGAAYGPGPAAENAPSGFFVDRNGQPAYRVGRNDTLSGIAARHLGRSSRWVQVLGMNRDQLKDANSLKIGMVLRLPLDATQVGVLTGSTIAR